jgi:hypothetical protein
VRVIPEEREDPVHGRRQVRMRVPYLGYAPIARAAGGSDGRDARRPESLAPVDAWSRNEDASRHASADGASEDDPF